MNNDPTIAVEKWPGLNTRVEPHLFGLNGLVVADNLRVDGTGTQIATRDGQCAASALVARGAFATKDKGRAYCIDSAGNLRSFPDETILRAGFEGLPYWIEFNDYILVGNNSQVWRVYPDGTVRDNALAPPDAPVVETRPGNLPEGVYRFLAVNVESGEESAPSEASSITVDGTQDIFVDVEPGTRIYVCPANATSFFRWPRTTATVYAMRPEFLGEQLKTRGLFPMPTGDCLAVYEGALYASTYIASHDVSAVWRSKGLWHGLADIAVERPRLFAGRVRCMAGNAQGLLIGTDREVGGIGADGLYTKYLNYGVPSGRAAVVDERGTIRCLTRRGFISAFPFEILNENFAPPDCDFASLALLREGGDDRLVAMVSIGGEPDNAAR